MTVLRGRYDFQFKYINKSYRNRGKVDRHHTHQKINSIVIIRMVSINMINEDEILDNTIIEEYSAIKIRANKPPPYSILNPDTNSLSPSEKSKGVRFDSLRQQISHINTTGLMKTIIFKFLSTYMFILRHNFNKKNEINRNDNEISYEMVCAIARSLPKNAYFLLDLHPAKNKP